MSSLKNKTIKGISWSFIDNIVNSGITFIVGLVLARILTPSEFGVLGAITIFISIANSIIDSGFSNALIRKNDVKSVDYNTVFFFNISLGIALYAILFQCSPLISRFFKEPILIAVTRAMGLILIINSFAIVQRTLLIKQINFKTQARISIIASIVSGFVGISMAVAGFGVWSLVGQQIVRQLLHSGFLWMFNRWRPAAEFSISSFKELSSYGFKLLLSGLIDTVYKNIYYLIIGKFYSTAQLGQYTRSEQFNTVFSSNLTSVVQRVSFPVLSTLQDEADRLKQAYRRVIKLTMLVTFTCMLGLAAVAKPLVLLLIGDKWLPSVFYLQIICFSGMLYPLHAINLNILQVKGRSDLFLKLEIIKKTLAVIPISLGIFFGIEYMLFGSVIISFISYFLNSYFSADLLDYSSWSQIRDILPVFLISILISAGMWSMTFLDFSIKLTLVLQCLLGLILSILIYENIKLPEYTELKDIIFSTVKINSLCRKRNKLQ